MTWQHSVKKINLHNFKFLNTLQSQYYTLSDFNSELTPEKDKIRVTFSIRKPQAHAISQISDIENDCIVGIKTMQNEITPSLFLFVVYLPSDTDISSNGKCYYYMNTLFMYYSNYGHVNFVGDFHSQYLEPVNGYIQIQKADKIINSQHNEPTEKITNSQGLIKYKKSTLNMVAENF